MILSLCCKLTNASPFPYLLTTSITYCRFQGTYKDRTCPRKLRNMSRSSMGKEVIEPLQSHELPTVDLHDDEHMHFQTIRNDLSPHHPVGQKEFVDDMDVGVDSHANIQIEKQSPIAHLSGIPTFKAEVNTNIVNPSNTANVSNEAPHLDLDDNMVPEEVNTGIGSNSRRDMWVGREFPY